MSEDVLRAKDDRDIAFMLGTVLGLFVKHEHPSLLEYDTVTCVPSVRPQDHSEIIAHAFCNITKHRGFRTDLLIRTGGTKMVGRGRVERWKIARNEFGLGHGHLASGASVLLIDDILTDGATLDTCATLLRPKGASRVHGLVVARAI